MDPLGTQLWRVDASSTLFAIARNNNPLMYWHEDLCHYRKYVDVGEREANQWTTKAFVSHSQQKKKPETINMRWYTLCCSNGLFGLVRWRTAVSSHWGLLYFRRVKIYNDGREKESLNWWATIAFLRYARKWENWLTKTVVRFFGISVASSAVQTTWRWSI